MVDSSLMWPYPLGKEEDACSLSKHLLYPSTENSAKLLLFVEYTVDVSQYTAMNYSEYVHHYQASNKIYLKDN